MVASKVASMVASMVASKVTMGKKEISILHVSGHL